MQGTILASTRDSNRATSRSELSIWCCLSVQLIYALVQWKRRPNLACMKADRLKAPGRNLIPRRFKVVFQGFLCLICFTQDLFMSHKIPKSNDLTLPSATFLLKCRCRRSLHLSSGYTWWLNRSFKVANRRLIKHPADLASY